MKVLNKHQMLALLSRGELGNTTRIWNNLDDLLNSGFQGPVAVRYKLPGNSFQEGLPTILIPERVKELLRKGLDQRLMYFHEWTLPESLVLNCHFMRNERYAELAYSKNKNIQIDQCQKSGLIAVVIIKTICGQESWEMLCELSERYPDSVIEFTFHDRAVGLGGNMVIWEVRNY